MKARGPQGNIADELSLKLQESSDRCLVHTTSWLAQLLVSLPSSESSQPSQKTVLPHLELVKSLFHLKEYQRAWHGLERRRVEGRVPETLTEQFLRLYAFYMAGEKVKQERDECHWHSTASKKIPAQNPHLRAIQEELLQDSQELDTYLLFLYGIICKGLKLQSNARDAFVQSVALNPWNLGAWQELTSIVSSAEEMNRILCEMPEKHMMMNVFQILASVESDLYPLEQILPLFDSIESVFLNNSWMKTQKALIYYNNRDFDETETLFEDILKTDPYNLDFVDTYSNLLYVKQKPLELSVLAKTVYTIDRYRPESCNVIGNMYSLKGEHEKAVSYFRRSLRLDPQFLSAWTLLGHEYLELKNWNSAIQAYRMAVEISSKDYRAWFGLGQTYELLRMPHYAIFYLQKAAALKPYDMRIWQTLGDVYRNIKKPSTALACYKRSLSASEVIAPGTLASIAKIYAGMKSNEKDAATWYQLFMEDGRGSEEDSEAACIYLAHYYMDQRDFKKTNKYLEEILHTEEGKVIQRELKSLEKNRNFETLMTSWL